MNQRRIDRLIPLAFKILEEENGVAKEIFKTIGGEKKIISEYKGYMSSIGPSVVQAGLIKTLAAFIKKGGGEEDKTITCELIKTLLKNDGYYTSEEYRQNLLEIITARQKKDNTTLFRLREEDRILEAITAYKLVFDTYAKYDKKERGVV